jgi:hypothetical protein
MVALQMVKYWEVSGLAFISVRIDRQRARKPSARAVSPTSRLTPTITGHSPINREGSVLENTATCRSIISMARRV